MAGGWTTADYALIVSIGSAGVSLFSLGWNIWSKFIYPKPRIRVWADVKGAHLRTGHVVSFLADGTYACGFPHAEISNPAISVAATNFGPGPVKIDTAIGKVGRWHRGLKKGHAIIIPYNDYPHDLKAKGLVSKNLPRKLEAGDEIVLYFPVTDELIGNGALIALGVRDSFSRMHWASRRNMSNLRKQARALRAAQQ